ncbi:MAG TPA: hypothetical protein VGE64_03940 [Xanthomonadaceae bacterium]
MDAERAISLAMTFWQLGIASEYDIIAWADARIRDSEQPDMRLIDLSTLGPKHCDKRPREEFDVEALQLPFPIIFSAVAPTLDLADDGALLIFARQASIDCISTDGWDRHPIMDFGYQVDHLLCDMQSPQSAVGYIREQLPGLLQRYSDLWPYRLDDIRIDA